MVNVGMLVDDINDDDVVKSGFEENEEDEEIVEVSEIEEVIVLNMVLKFELEEYVL